MIFSCSLLVMSKPSLTHFLCLHVVLRVQKSSEHRMIRYQCAKEHSWVPSYKSAL